jgi:hypothetical protein
MPLRQKIYPAHSLSFAIMVNLLFAPAVAKSAEKPVALGTIYGLVVDQSGQPARGIALEAHFLRKQPETGNMLFRSKSDQQGRFRFTNLPWWGPYTVYADDAGAGYSLFATRWQNSKEIQAVTLSPDHPEAEFNFKLPAPAGFLQFHLTNSKTGEEIKGIQVSYASAEEPTRTLYETGCASDHPVLIPPDEDLLLHVKSWGFKEWIESAGRGKPFRIASGAHITLDVALDPDKR